MMNQSCAVFTKEYPTAGGVLVIENIAKGIKKKSDVIREILDSTACLGNSNLIQLNCRNKVDCGSQVKEAEH